MHRENIPVINGWSGDDTFFRFIETSSINGEHATAVLEGKLAGVIFRNVVDKKVCETISGRFWEHPHRKRRNAEAPGFYIGALHWLTPLPKLMSEVSQAKAAIATILDVAREPISELNAAILDASKGSISGVRAAAYNNTPVCDRLIRAWDGPGHFSLAPHEDESQTQWPDQQDFEIQEITNHPICAVNVCIENTNGGELHYWNIRPDKQTRLDLGVQFSGIPYPEEFLHGFQKKVISIRAGDVYLFNGSMLHAVASKTANHDRRTTLSCLAGLTNSRELIQWT